MYRRIHGGGDMIGSTFDVLDEIVDDLAHCSVGEVGEVLRALEYLYCSCGKMRAHTEIKNLMISATLCEHVTAPNGLMERAGWLSERERADKTAALLVRSEFA